MSISRLPVVGDTVRLREGRTGKVEQIFPVGSQLTREQVKEFFDPETYHVSRMNAWEQRRKIEGGENIRPYCYQEAVEHTYRSRMRPQKYDMYVVRKDSGHLVILFTPCFLPHSVVKWLFS